MESDMAGSRRRKGKSRAIWDFEGVNGNWKSRRLINISQIHSLLDVFAISHITVLLFFLEGIQLIAVNSVLTLQTTPMAFRCIDLLSLGNNIILFFHTLRCYRLSWFFTWCGCHVFRCCCAGSGNQLLSWEGKHYTALRITQRIPRVANFSSVNKFKVRAYSRVEFFYQAKITHVEIH